MLWYVRNSCVQIHFFYEDQLYIKLAKKICAKKKIICANEKKSASMKMLMPVLGKARHKGADGADSAPFEKRSAPFENHLRHLKSSQ